MLRISLVAWLAILMTACGDTDSDRISEPASITVQGNAVKGVIEHGLVRIYYENAAGTEIDIGHTRTDANGNFAINLPALESKQVALVDVTADTTTRMRCDRTTGCESGFGFFEFAETMPLPAHFKLRGVADVESGNAFVSPLSHLIVQAAQQGSGALTLEALKRASAQVMKAFHLEQNPLLTRTPDLTDLTWEAHLSSAQLKQAIASAALLEHTFSPAWSRDFVALASLDMETLALQIAELAEQFHDRIETTQAQYAQVLARISEKSLEHYQTLTEQPYKNPKFSAANRGVAFVQSQSSSTTEFPDPIKITKQPEDQVATPGSTVTLSVAVSGTGPFTYQWYQWWSYDMFVPLADSNGPTLTLPNVPVAFNLSSLFVHVTSPSNPAGVYSYPARLNISSAMPLPAFIETQPTAQNLNVGQPLLLQVRASGDTPIYYQWLKNNTPIAGATSSRFSIGNATLADAGAYSVQVYNHGNTVPVRSQTVSVSVKSNTVPLAITDQPESRASSPGGSVTFSVAVSGTGPVSYQWRRNGSTLISGANGPTLTLGNLSLADNNSYFDVLVSSPASPNGIRSTSARLNINTPTIPANILSQPTAQTLSAGQPLLLQVSASGDAPIRYQWLKNNTPIAGAATSSLSIERVTLEDAGSYSVQVHNAVNGTPVLSNAAKVTVLSIQSPLVITTHPVEQVATPGSTVTLSVAVSGTGPFTYQWYQWWSYDMFMPFVDSNGPTLTLPNVPVSFNLSFVVVHVSSPSNPTGVYSYPARLYIRSAMPLPAFIESQPTAQNLNVGQPLLLQVRASGDTPIHYQWLKNNSPIAGATSSSFRIASVSLADTGSFSVQVSNQGNTVPARSQSVTVQVSDPNAQLAITRQPQDVVVASGGSATFSVNVTAATGLTYQWFKDNDPSPVYTGGSIFRIANAQSEHAGSYRVTIRSADGTRMVTSNTAMLRLQASNSVLLSWSSPTTRVDRSTLEADEIDGYILQYGFSTNSFTHEVRVYGADTLNHELQFLPQGTVYFRIATIDSHNQQGPFSAPIALTIP